MPITKEKFNSSIEKGYSFYRSYVSNLSDRISEIKGKISKPLFESLIKADIQRTFDTIPPLKNELDYPAALRSLARDKSLDSKAKEERAKELRSEFTRQIRGMANCRLIIERVIQNNPKISKKVLDSYLELFAKEYGLPKLQLESYLETINSFDIKRNAIAEVRKIFPKDDELFKKLLPEYYGKIEGYAISTSPYEIIIKTSTSNIKKLNPLAVGFATYREISLNNKSPNQLFNIPIIFVPDDYSKEVNSIILTHEREHSKNEFIIKSDDASRSFLSKTYKTDMNLSEIYERSLYFLISKIPIKPSLNEEEIKYWSEKITQGEMSDAYVKTYFRLINDSIPENFERIVVQAKEALKIKINLYLLDSLHMVQDEIIAMKKDGVSDFFSVLGSNLAYTYKLPAIESVFTSLQEKNIDIGITYDDIKSKFTREVNKSSQAFDDLMIKGGFSRDECVAILASVPLTSWAMVVKGILIDYNKGK